MVRFSILIAFCFLLQGCGNQSSAPVSLSDIEDLMSQYRVVTFMPMPGDQVTSSTGGPSIIEVYRGWSDKVAENGTSFVPKIRMMVNVAGDSKSVEEMVRKYLESSPLAAKSLLRHQDDRIRFAAYHTLDRLNLYQEGRWKPLVSDYSSEIVKELARKLSGGDVYEASLAERILNAEHVFCMEAFVSGMHHPCAQVRLMALKHLTFSNVSFEQHKIVLGHLVEHLDDRDRIVRKATYSNLISVLAGWPKNDSPIKPYAGRNLTEEQKALIDSAPNQEGNKRWFQGFEETEVSILALKEPWQEWLKHNNLPIVDPIPN